MTERTRPRRPFVERLARWILATCVLVGLAASLLATPRPLVARVDGTLRFPAVVAWLGLEDSPVPAGHAGWREWVAEGRDDGEWALPAPVPFGPDEAFPARIGAGPSALHPLGNDDTGRDVAARLVHGTRTALVTAALVVLLAGVVGVALGAVAAMSGGVVDFLVLRFLELSTCFPVLVLILCVAAFVDASFWMVPCVLAFVYQAAFARIVRGEILHLRSQEWYVAAERGFGVRGLALLRGHVWPQIRGRVETTAAFVAASSIVAESTLRFLGLGGTGAVVSWGELAAQFRATGLSAWHVWLFPCLTIGVVVVALHTLAGRAPGTGLRGPLEEAR